MKKSIIITAILSMTIFACKDKEKDQPTPKPALSAKQTMLIGKDWKIKTVVFEGNDITSMMPACVLDNVVYHFTDASSGYYDEGGSKCNPSDPQKENITWKLYNNETRLITTDPEGTDTFDVINVTAAELKLGVDKGVITLKN
jgi:hypothetical protein